MTKKRKKSKVKSVAGIPDWVTTRLYDRADHWHLTEEGDKWLKKMLKAKGLTPQQLNPLIGAKKSTTRSSVRGFVA